MYAVYGSALTAAGILAIALLALLFAHPSAPRWTQRELTAQLASVGVTLLLGFGLGCLVFLAPQQMRAEGVTVVEIAALGGTLALVVLVLRTLKIGARRRAYQATAVTEIAIPTAHPPTA